ncbi:probable serine/threonine-protein kinase kinX [Clytia hemisphaerica]|uniref:probable serine/threonine-protein kinase kinX n=1 Tax=Clytia hemisphaerica TaxID=252671 RepID=UPI0034D75F55
MYTNHSKNRKRSLHQTDVSKNKSLAPTKKKQKIFKVPLRVGGVRICARKATVQQQINRRKKLFLARRRYKLICKRSQKRGLYTTRTIKRGLQLMQMMLRDISRSQNLSVNATSKQQNNNRQNIVATPLSHGEQPTKTHYDFHAEQVELAKQQQRIEIDPRDQPIESESYGGQPIESEDCYGEQPMRSEDCYGEQPMRSEDCYGGQPVKMQCGEEPMDIDQDCYNEVEPMEVDEEEMSAEQFHPLYQRYLQLQHELASVENNPFITPEKKRVMIDHIEHEYNIIMNGNTISPPNSPFSAPNNLFHSPPTNPFNSPQDTQKTSMFPSLFTASDYASLTFQQAVDYFNRSEDNIPFASKERWDRFESFGRRFMIDPTYPNEIEMEDLSGEPVAVEHVEQDHREKTKCDNDVKMEDLSEEPITGKHLERHGKETKCEVTDVEMEDVSEEPLPKKKAVEQTKAARSDDKVFEGQTITKTHATYPGVESVKQESFDENKVVQNVPVALNDQQLIVTEQISPDQSNDDVIAEKISESSDAGDYQRMMLKESSSELLTTANETTYSEEVKHEEFDRCIVENVSVASNGQRIDVEDSSACDLNDGKDKFSDGDGPCAKDDKPTITPLALLKDTENEANDNLKLNTFVETVTSEEPSIKLIGEISAQEQPELIEAVNEQGMIQNASLIATDSPSQILPSFNVSPADPNKEGMKSDKAEKFISPIESECDSNKEVGNCQSQGAFQEPNLDIITVTNGYCTVTGRLNQISSSLQFCPRKQTKDVTASQTRAEEKNITSKTEHVTEDNSAEENLDFLQKEIKNKKSYLKFLKSGRRSLKKDAFSDEDNMNFIQNEIIDVEKDLSKLKRQLPRSLRRICPPKNKFTKTQKEQQPKTLVNPQNDQENLTSPQTFPKTLGEGEYQLIEDDCLERSLASNEIEMTSIEALSPPSTPREDNLFINTPSTRRFQ